MLPSAWIAPEPNAALPSNVLFWTVTFWCPVKVADFDIATPMMALVLMAKSLSSTTTARVDARSVWISMPASPKPA